LSYPECNERMSWPFLELDDVIFDFVYVSNQNNYN
jgi:hypothetical protein